MTKILSLHSFRGGTGKSNLTANLAVAVCQAGKRVGVVDTDIQSPGIHVLFGMEHTALKYALNDYLWGQCRIDQAAYEIVKTAPACPSSMPPGLFLIPSSLSAGNIARILREGYDVGLLHDGFRALGKALSLDFLFIDTHPGVNEETLLSIAISDTLLLILRPDNQDMLGSVVTVELARRLEVPHMSLLINKVPPGVDFQSLSQRTSQTFGVPVGGVFALNVEMAHMGSSGIFALRYPDHPFSVEVRRVAESLLSHDAQGKS